jgi:hypothetical protein
VIYRSIHGLKMAALCIENPAVFRKTTQRGSNVEGWF